MDEIIYLCHSKIYLSQSRSKTGLIRLFLQLILIFILQSISLKARACSEPCAKLPYEDVIHSPNDIFFVLSLLSFLSCSLLFFYGHNKQTSNFTPDFSNSPIFQTNFRFPWRFVKSGFHCNQYRPFASRLYFLPLYQNKSPRARARPFL